MRRAVAGIAVLLFALSAVAWTAGPAVTRGGQYISSQQSSDGSFSNPQTTGETLAAMLAGHVTGTPVSKALAYLKSHGKAGATEAAYTGRIIAGLVAAKQDPRSFGGVNYVDILHSQYDASTGNYDDKNFFSDLIAANGANAAKDPLPSQAVSFIETGQCDDGGFSALGCDQGSDVDTTAWAINVLIASGHRSDDAVPKARSYLVGVERSDGGFSLSTDASCNCNFMSVDSTGLAISAINALGEDPTKAPWVKKNSANPVTSIERFQKTNGSFRANAQTNSGNLVSTVNAVPALSHHSYPVAIKNKPKPSATPRRTAPGASDEPSGGGSGSGSGGGGAGTVPGTGTSGSHNATDTARVATSTNKQAAAAAKSSASSSKGKKAKGSKASPGPSNLGFGGITTKHGGIPITAWAAIALGCAGIGTGVWFLRARFR